MLEDELGDEESDPAPAAGRRRPPSSNTRRGLGNGGKAAKPSTASKGERGTAPRRTASRRTARPALSVRSGGGSGNTGGPAAAAASEAPADLLHIDPAKLQAAAAALVRLLEVKNTAAQPTIVEATDVAV